MYHESQASIKQRMCFYGNLKTNIAGFQLAQSNSFGGGASVVEENSKVSSGKEFASF